MFTVRFRSRCGGPLALLFLAGGLFAPITASAAPATVRANPAIVQQAVQDGERVWRAVRAEPAANLASRDLLTYALALCEASAHPDRLERLFTVATQMQQRDRANRGYGNFRWSWSHAEVFDFNAVDFCLQAGAILWLRHRETLPPAARDLLRPLLEHGIEGLVKHRVNESYTNIALMNAGNLLLLGEACGRPEIAAEGAARLDRIILHLAEAGVHEYVSPTYYGVDLDDVMLIEVFSANPRARAQARVLWDFLWTDIALNWLPAAGKLAGARSRDYDYLRGLGYLDQQLQANGWIPPVANRASGVIFLAYLPAPVSPAIRQLSEKFPRLVTQSWGLDRGQTRTHYLCADVTLSSAGAGYGGRMDLPLTIDLPGPREGVRGFFIPDGRGDPYGKIKIQESQAHAKTLHLRPFWTAAQRRVDALGLVLYRPIDVPDDTRTLESHFVLPLEVDEIWVGAEPVRFVRAQAASHRLPPGAAVVLRKGTAMVGVRVPWSRQVAAAEAAAALVCDANNFGAMRVTVTHHVGNAARPAAVWPGAAFWVRIGSGLKTPEAVAQWRRDFVAAKAESEVTPLRVGIRVAGQDGPVVAAAQAPWQNPGMSEPRAPRHVLACDGEDLGTRLLGAIEPVRTLRASGVGREPIRVPATGGVAWEAEAGAVLPPMTTGADTSAGTGFFVWMPAQPGERAGSAVGRTRFALTVDRAGARHLWGRVLTPTPENDSFFVTAATEADVVLEPTAWPTGVHQEWAWVRFSPEAKKPFPVVLPQGTTALEIRVREAGAKLDRLFITTDPQEQPR
jgi:hypothetical protein